MSLYGRRLWIWNGDGERWREMERDGEGDVVRWPACINFFEKEIEKNCR